MAKPELRDHRKFRKLVRLLGDRVSHVIGYLDCMWHCGYQTGDPRLGEAEDVGAAADYPGDASKFAEAATESGFLDRNDDGTYSIHNLYKHAPRYVKLRMKRVGTAPTGAQCARPSAQTAHNVRRKRTKRAPSENQEPKPITENQEPKPRTESQEPRTETQEPKTENKPEDKDIAATPLAVDSRIVVRPRDEVWDAIVEITGTDASIKSNASHVGKIKKELLAANPPYTAEEILSLPRIAAVQLPWAAGRSLTLGEVLKNIGIVRARPPTVSENGKARSAMEEFLSRGAQ